jgi:APA family basic amino acid/polyamine antiporter
MGANGDLPRWLGSVHPEHRVPHHAELAVGALVAAVVLVADPRGAIGFSSFAVLAYYAIANASAWKLPSDQRRGVRVIAAAGVVGCVGLAFTLPIGSVISGLAVLGAGAAIWLARSRTGLFSGRGGV